MTLDLVQTVAFAGLILFLGYGLRKLVPPLARVNIPAAVCGGLPLAGLLAVLHAYGYQPLTFTTTLQVPLQNTFFASIGFAASFALLRRGGPLVLGFFMIALVVAALQNVVGSAVAWMLGQHPLMGVLAGSVTLTGGPATGLAFAPLFEQAGVPGAATLAVAAAMAGIVAGGVMGGPIGTYLVERRAHGITPGRPAAGTLENLAENQIPAETVSSPAGEDAETYVLLKHLVVLLVTVGIGIWVSAWLTGLGLTLFYVALGPSLVAYRAWGLGVAQAGPAVAAFMSNLTPLFAALMSGAVLDEWPRAFHGLAFALIVGGIVVSSWPKSAPQQST